MSSFLNWLAACLGKHWGSVGESGGVWDGWWVEHHAFNSRELLKWYNCTLTQIIPSKQGWDIFRFYSLQLCSSLSLQPWAFLELAVQWYRGVKRFSAFGWSENTVLKWHAKSISSSDTLRCAWGLFTASDKDLMCSVSDSGAGAMWMWYSLPLCHS